ncbi:DUF1405 domain-containing protein [Mangrovibacillus cuniculi]|uniref:DUF1405 domain-containing protein n=1 Tax=Mangrovibacillus cuniculi TaxID=2593652 RepID=A0A7S8CB30_9BACI|nr:DUF1405 domain-containing protein [Mangrovibacillus cuniculi]QPC46683.1 DUF1405 domain-containing protein [Mangrovibacillus cuniculi]
MSLSFLLNNRSFLWLLFFINLLGTVYGYYWYIPQLVITEPIYLVFVPDSPTASLFFSLALLGILLKRQSGLLEALAFVTLIKYGVWAVAMNGLSLIVEGDLSWQGYMLMASHGAMAIQAVIYRKRYVFRSVHLLIAGVWTLHNDVIDYVFQQFPYYRVIPIYFKEVGYFTFWLSMFCLFIGYMLVIKPRKFNR